MNNITNWVNVEVVKHIIVCDSDMCPLYKSLHIATAHSLFFGAARQNYTDL